MFQVILLFLTGSVCTTNAFSFEKTPLANLLGGVIPKPQPPTPNTSNKPDPATVLRELNLQSSTEPKRFTIGENKQIPALLGGSIGTALRFGSGVFGANYKVGLTDANKSKYSILQITDKKQIEETCFTKIPTQPIEIYENEANSSCRLVREACSMLSLEVMVYPIPKNGPRYTDEIGKKFGNIKNEYPFLYDPNTAVRLNGSERCIDFLFTTYGPGNVPWTLQQPIDKGINWAQITAFFANRVSGKGGTYQDSTYDGENDVPLILWQYEGSPFCKVVREKLSTYQIPHKIIYTPRGSINRERLLEQTGRFQVPYLEDPNTGVNLFESAAIVEYIDKKYGIASTPVKYL